MSKVHNGRTMVDWSCFTFNSPGTIDQLTKAIFLNDYAMSPNGRSDFICSLTILCVATKKLPCHQKSMKPYPFLKTRSILKPCDTLVWPFCVAVNYD